MSAIEKKLSQRKRLNRRLRHIAAVMLVFELVLWFGFTAYQNEAEHHPKLIQIETAAE